MFGTLLAQLSRLLFFILHVSGSGSFPRPLSAQEEQQALVRLAAGDRQARTELIEHNLRLVAHIIKKYYPNTADQDDLISIGTIGLIKAIDSFDAGKGIRLSSYASRCIENEVLMFFRASKKTEKDVSMNDPIDTDKDGNELTLMDTLSCEDDLAEALDLKVKSEKLYGFLARVLTPRERTIVVLRYGINGTKPLAQREVARQLHISRSYVSRLETKALQKLRDAFSKNGKQSV